ncbi:MAG TPA: sigma-54 dependent transcriptional regulator [Sandaracinaceae bacterium LLY-WYZ-13_1]|nr:sigma-54 dependent transcriptional regulator [Sandaracinaceae bacterium LLY-WYZ-13_1]
MPSSLARHERLRGVQTARAILRDAFGLELTVVGPEGPLAHRQGGVMVGSHELCRAALFSRDGFVRCDAFYRGIGETEAGGRRRCHLELEAIHVPVVVGGEVLGHLVASGFIDPRSPLGAPPDAAALARGLAALDPFHPDPAEPARDLRVVRGDRTDVVRAILAAAAREIEIHEADARRALEEGDELPGLWGMVGASPAMRELFELIERVVRSDATVLVSGESGTGKELVARALHEHGPRADGPFVATNCGAVPADVLESTLFGHVAGAFSGAIRSSEGLFGAADGGTLFLDEVGETSPAMQVKLLRVLQDGTYLPVGATEVRRANVRVVAASHRDLSEMVAAGTFRQDLFYRLHVLTLRLPPLRDRPGDLSLLLRHLMRGVEGAPPRVGDAAWRCLERYAWPGNVRELRAEVERWAVTAAGEREVGPEHLSAAVREAGGYGGGPSGEAVAAAAAGRGTLAAAVEALERAIIARGLERTEGNRTQLAKELGISRTTLHDRLERFGLS